MKKQSAHYMQMFRCEWKIGYKFRFNQREGLIPRSLLRSKLDLGFAGFDTPLLAAG